MPPSSTANLVFGTLSGVDINSDETFVYSIVGGANSTLFNIAGSSLRLSNAGQRGNNLEVIVRVTDHGGLTYSATFSVSEGFYDLLHYFVFLFCSYCDLCCCVFCVNMQSISLPPR